MISLVCDRCHEELTEPGGLLFGPPDADGYARKYHACKRCFAIVLAEHFGGKPPG